MRLFEDPRLQPAEDFRIALVLDLEAPDRDAVDALDSSRKLVAPGDVVFRARSEHFDVRVPREPLGDVTRMQLRPAIDVAAVPLNDDGELHPSACWGWPATCRAVTADRTRARRTTRVGRRATTAVPNSRRRHPLGPRCRAPARRPARPVVLRLP